MPPPDSPLTALSDDLRTVQRTAARVGSGVAGRVSTAVVSGANAAGSSVSVVGGTVSHISSLAVMDAKIIRGRVNDAIKGAISGIARTIGSSVDSVCGAVVGGVMAVAAVVGGTLMRVGNGLQFICDNSGISHVGRAVGRPVLGAAGSVSDATIAGAQAVGKMAVNTISPPVAALGDGTVRVAEFSVDTVVRTVEGTIHGIGYAALASLRVVGVGK